MRQSFLTFAAIYAVVLGTSSCNGGAANVPDFNTGTAGPGVQYQQIERLARPAVKELFQQFANHDGTNRTSPAAHAAVVADAVSGDRLVHDDRRRARRRRHAATLQAILIPDEIAADLSQPHRQGVVSRRRDRRRDGRQVRRARSARRRDRHLARRGVRQHARRRSGSSPDDGKAVAVPDDRQRAAEERAGQRHPGRVPVCRGAALSCASPRSPSSSRARSSRSRRGRCTSARAQRHSTARSRRSTPAPVKPDWRVRDPNIAFLESRAGKVRGDMLTPRMLSAEYLQRYRERGDLGDVLRAEHAARLSLAAHAAPQRRRATSRSRAHCSRCTVSARRKPRSLDARRTEPDNAGLAAEEAGLDLELGDVDGARRLIGCAPRRSRVRRRRGAARRRDRPARRRAQRWSTARCAAPTRSTTRRPNAARGSTRAPPSSRSKRATTTPRAAPRMTRSRSSPDHLRALTILARVDLADGKNAEARSRRAARRGDPAESRGARDARRRASGARRHAPPRRRRATRSSRSRRSATRSA